MPQEDEIVLGYCTLCRVKEDEMYGSVGGWSSSPDDLNDELKHALACKAANCKHPCIYIFDHENKTTVGVLYDTIIDTFESDEEETLVQT
jgi:hypothetical protein